MIIPLRLRPSPCLSWNRADRGKIAHDRVAGTRSLGCVHKVRALTPGTLRLVLNNFSQSSIERCDAKKVCHSCVVRTCEFSHAHKVRSFIHRTPRLAPTNFSQSSTECCDAEKLPSTALQEPIRSVAAVGADIIRPRNQHSPRLCDVMRKNRSVQFGLKR